ncbi:MAG: hypothetical protein Q7T12_01960 [Flavobacterium sp.]|nr:hypothetical protein [Flavobacterium sp.]
MTEEEFLRRKNRTEIPYEERVKMSNEFHKLLEKGKPTLKLETDIEFKEQVTKLKEFLISKGINDSILKIEIRPTTDKNQEDRLCVNLLEDGQTLFSTNYINI